MLPSSRVLAALLSTLVCALLLPCAPALASGALPWFAPGQQANASTTASAPAPAARASAPDPQAALLTLLAACPAPANATAASPDPAVQAAALVLLAACPAPAAAALPAAAAPAEPGLDPAAQAAILARLAAAPVPANATAAADPDPAAEPADPDGQAQFALLRRYFRSQLTLAEDFPEVFSRRVKDSETMAFMTMCAMQRKRGLLERFRSAEVDVSRLVFTRVTRDPDLARIRVTGRYSFTLGPSAKVEEEPRAIAGAEGPQSRIEDAALARTEGHPQIAPNDGSNDGPEAPVAAAHKIQETLEEDALFVLLPEMGEWKIYERREGWRP